MDFLNSLVRSEGLLQGGRHRSESTVHRRVVREPKNTRVDVCMYVNSHVEPVVHQSLRADPSHRFYLFPLLVGIRLHLTTPV